MKPKMNSLFILSLVFFILSAYTKENQDPQWKGTIEDENGVKVIKNPKEPMYNGAPFELEEELTIGGRDAQEEYIFQQIWHLAVDAEENIYLPDFRGSHLKVFDKNGKYLRTIGRRGRGPGEIMVPFAIQINPDNELFVNNRGQTRLTFFDLDGNFLRQISTHNMIRFMLPKVDSRGNIIAGYMKMEDELTAYITKFDSELEPILTLAKVPTRTQPPVINFFENQRLINLHWDIFKDDHIILGEIFDYTFYIYTPDGKLVKKIITDYEGIKISGEDKDKLIKEEFGDNPISSRIKLEFPKNLPPWRQFTCDEEGRIIVRSYENAGEGKGVFYDIFDPEGKYIARIALKTIPRFWKSNKLYTIGLDDDDFPVVKRYRVIWK